MSRRDYDGKTSREREEKNLVVICVKVKALKKENIIINLKATFR